MKKIVPIFAAFLAFFLYSTVHASVVHYDRAPGGPVVPARLTFEWSVFPPVNIPPIQSAQLIITSLNGFEDIKGQCFSAAADVQLTHTETLSFPDGYQANIVTIQYNSDVNCQNQDAGEDDLEGAPPYDVVLFSVSEPSGADGSYDVVCSTVGSSSVCTDPWNYEKGAIVDILIVCIGGYFVARLLLKT